MPYFKSLVLHLLGPYIKSRTVPCRYTHTSIAIPGAIRSVNLPAVEVRLSDINNREDFRKISFTASACIATVAGKGF
ncbi:MAG: type II 3-dehydroquinate dehydratase [Synergistaceae bacterium]|nr:type II 3-dehydroquinate dehydratase [Synergistaceae bacterium]